MRSRSLQLLVTTLLLAASSACSPGPVCAAVPTCEEDEQEVDECEAGATDCREVTVCDSTIFCGPAPTDGGQ